MDGAPRQASDLISSSLLQSKIERSTAIVTSKGAVAADLALLTFFAKKKSFKGLILCVDRPASYYLEMLKANGIESKGMHFINVGFKEAGENMESTEENAGDLTFMKIAVVRMAQKMRLDEPGAKLFFLNDAVTTLLLYSEEKTLGQFLHDLNNTLRELEVYQITVVGPGETMANLAKKLADVVVELD